MPETIADDCARRRTSARVIGGSEQAAGDRLDTQHAKKIAAHPQATSVARFAAGGQVEPGATPGKNAGESLLMIADLFPERVGQVRVAAGEVSLGPMAVGDPDHGEFLRILDRQGAQANGVDQLKDGGVSADAERE